MQASSGITRPVVVDILCTDGRRHRQLLKQVDDLRQDAVLQQTFRAANHLLMQDLVTRAKNLSMRTYSVVPLTPELGLVQWVHRTLPLSEILLEGRKVCNKN